MASVVIEDKRQRLEQLVELKREQEEKDRKQQNDEKSCKAFGEYVTSTLLNFEPSERRRLMGNIAELLSQRDDGESIKFFKF